MSEILETKRSDLFKIDPRNIIIDEDFNVRKDYGDIEWLTNNIIEMGMLDPIKVAKIRGTDQYTLTDGFRRMRAVLKAIEKGHEIPYVRAEVTSGNMEDRLLAMLITGIGKKVLNNLEEGEAYKQLIAYEYDVKDIVRKVNKSTAHVYNMLKLADAPMAVKKHIIAGRISGNTVVTLINANKDVDSLINAVNDTLASAGVEELVTNGKVKKATARHTGILSPVKKLEKALEIAMEKEYSNVKLLHELLSKLNNKDIKPESIAKLFQ